MSLLPPKQLRGLQIHEVLGEGGMAIVYRGEDRLNPGRPLAVKVLRSEVAQQPEFVRRFLREGEVLKRLSHPHLVKVFDFGQERSWIFLIMEYLPKGHFRSCFGEAPAQIVRRLLPVLSALQVAHEAGIVHRDLKPSNLLFDVSGHLKVTDFGVCLWEEENHRTRLTHSHMVVGTLGYMAPEQSGDPRLVDSRADVFAIASILYEFTTGTPYTQVLAPPAHARKGFPPKLALILVRALAPQPARRTVSMAVLASELGEWLETAEAATWGSHPLPGYALGDREVATVIRSKASTVDTAEDQVETRLGPYVDMLRTGPVGRLREAEEGLLRHSRETDEDWLLQALKQAPQTATRALVRVLGQIGSEASLPLLMARLDDPYCLEVAPEAMALLALRKNLQKEALAALRKLGENPGPPRLWMPRALLGDSLWLESILAQWPQLSSNLQVSALQAAQHLPSSLRSQAKKAFQPLARTGRLAELWKELG